MTNLLRLRRLGVAFLIVAGVALLLAACGGSGSDKDSSDPGASASASAPASGTSVAEVINTSCGAGYYCGALLQDPLPRPDMTLTDTKGQPFNIAKDTQGELTLVYMGYTHCPDICPTFMAQLGAVMKNLPPDISDKIKVVFVTTDPARDTGPVLRNWLDSFDEDFIGLTGTDEQIAEISPMLGMPAPTKEDLGNGNYAVSHGSLIYAFDKNDNDTRIVYPEGFPNEDLRNDFIKLVTNGFQADKADAKG